MIILGCLGSRFDLIQEHETLVCSQHLWTRFALEFRGNAALRLSDFEMLPKGLYLRWLEEPSGTPQVLGSTPRESEFQAEVKKNPLAGPVCQSTGCEPAPGRPEDPYMAQAGRSEEHTSESSHEDLSRMPSSA